MTPADDWRPKRRLGDGSRDDGRKDRRSDLQISTPRLVLLSPYPLPLSPSVPARDDEQQAERGDDDGHGDAKLH